MNTFKTSIFLAALASASWATTRGPDAGGYTATDAAVYSFVDVSGTGASVLAGVDDGAVPLTVPFSFVFYGSAYTMVCASSNGALYFIASAAACTGINDFANADLTAASPAAALPAALPFWSDLSFQIAGGGAVFYQTLGAPATAGSSCSGTTRTLRDLPIPSLSKSFCLRPRIRSSFNTRQSVWERGIQHRAARPQPLESRTPEVQPAAGRSSGATTQTS